MVVAVLSAASACSSETPNYPDPNVNSTGPGNRLSYHGRKLEFPIKSVDVVSSENYSYARLKPQGSLDRFDYFVELGRPWSGKTDQPGSRKAIGGYFFGPRATARPLSNGYVLWCEPTPGEPESGSCAVELKSLPLAALLFPIGGFPPAAKAIAAIEQSETFLQKAIEK